MTNILITGGAGYLGSKLVPQLLQDGYKIKVFDLLIYGKDVLPKNENLEVIKGDIRDQKLFEKAVKGMLPKNPLGRAMFGKLKVYAGAEHPHSAQQPKELLLNKGKI